MRSTRLVIPCLLLSTLITQLAVLSRGAPEPPPASDRDLAAAMSRTVEAVSEELLPSVVSITSRSGGRIRARGSGVLISSGGLIVTNYHVIEGADRVRVTTSEGKETIARISGFDVETDLAVLDVAGRGYPHATLSEDPPPGIGTWVLALGNPLGFDHTVTFGIISARGRSLDIATYEDFIQTDAAINSGNSGGPLIDLDGQVIGINTAKEVVIKKNRAQELVLTGSQGLGFAIPAYMVRHVVDEIVEKGYVERGWFGISVVDVTGPMVRRLGADSAAYVSKVWSGSPAQDAGFEEGDIVQRIGDTPVTGSKGVLETIAKLAPGTKVAVDIWRNERKRVLVVDVGKRAPRGPERTPPVQE